MDLLTIVTTVTTIVTIASLIAASTHLFEVAKKGMGLDALERTLVRVPAQS